MEYNAKVGKAKLEHCKVQWKMLEAVGQVRKLLLEPFDMFEGPFYGELCKRSWELGSRVTRGDFSVEILEEQEFFGNGPWNPGFTQCSGLKYRRCNRVCSCRVLSRSALTRQDYLMKMSSQVVCQSLRDKHGSKNAAGVGLKVLTTKKGSTRRKNITQESYIIKSTQGKNITAGLL